MYLHNWPVRCARLAVSTWMWRLRVKNNKQIICWKRCVSWMKRLEVRNELKAMQFGVGGNPWICCYIGSDGLKQLLGFTCDLGKFCFCFTTLTIFVNWLETALVCREGKKVWFWKCWSGHSLRPLGCGNLTFELWEWQDASWALSRHWLIDWYIIYNIYNIYVQWIMLSSPYITHFWYSEICWNPSFAAKLATKHPVA